MLTSNFANNDRYKLNGISISRFVSKHQNFDGPEFPPLFPDVWLLNDYKNGLIDWEKYSDIYCDQLDCLNPQSTYDYLCDLAGDIKANEPILLCFESAKTLDTNPCHRRLVADWFTQELNIDVREWKKRG